MSRYVNRGVTDEIWAVADSEHDPAARIERLNSLMLELTTQSLDRYAASAFELKKDLWNVGQIAELMGLSERLVKRLISYYATSSGQWNPLKKMPRADAIDISNIVMRHRIAEIVKEKETTPDTNRD